jgi:hypothetical protein
MDTKSSSFSQILKQANQYPGFDEREEDGKKIYSINFFPNEILDFDNIYKKIKTWKSVIVYINNQIIDLADINKWLRCYRDKRKCQLSNPLFCYGASPFTFNLFGCHRAMIRDAYPESTDNWYEFGEMRKDGTFTIDKETVKRKIGGAISAECAISFEQVEDQDNLQLKSKIIENRDLPGIQSEVAVYHLDKALEYFKQRSKPGMLEKCNFHCWEAIKAGHSTGMAYERLIINYEKAGEIKKAIEV